MLKISETVLMAFSMIFGKYENISFASVYRHRAQKSAVAVASVVEGPSRCILKRVEQRRCL